MSNLLESSKNNYYIAMQKRAFDVEDFYPIDLFSNFVEFIEKTTTEKCTLESSCKIEQDKLYAGRFSIGFPLKSLAQVSAVYDFFEKVGSRVGVKIDYSLVQKFFSNDFDFSKMTEFLVGVDVRREVADSKLKIGLTIYNYPEKQAVAIEMNGGLDKDLQRLLVSDNILHLGFDFTLQGRSEIELYPYITKQDFVREDVQKRLAAVLSPQALLPLSVCNRICVGLSKANADKIVYYYLENLNDFFTYFSVNDNARRVHAYYREQPVYQMCVAVPEKELQTRGIEKMNLYYLI